MAEIIDGELVDDHAPLETAPAVLSEDSREVANYNPLDAMPAGFSQGLVSRQQNYDSLQLHLQGVLVVDKDFGEIKGNWQLFAPGGDKILGILGLGVQYPGIELYREAVLKGTALQEILASCEVINHAGAVVSEGAGACERSEVNDSLNRCIKMANKRARIDAVKRLPTITALFEDGFLEQMAAAQKIKAQQTAAQRAQQIRDIWDTGARLEVCPIGKSTTGKPWHDIEREHLEWMLANATDKPDIIRAVERELSRRGSQSAADPGSISTASSPGPSKEN